VIDALVVGAGIAGLQAAAELRARGVEVDLVDEAPSSPAAGAGIILHPNAIAHLGDARESVVRAGAEISAQRFNHATGQATEVAWEEVWGPGRRPTAIHRRVLARLLAERLPPRTIRWSTSVSDVEPGAGGVTVRFADGQRERYRIVLGADGVRSTVRQFVDPAAQATYLGTMYWRLTVPWEPPFDVTDWLVWRRGPRFFGTMPVGGGRTHVFLQVHLDRVLDVPDEERLPLMRAEAAHCGPPVEAMVGGLAPDQGLHVGPAFGIACRRWTAGRLALVGDSAHAFSPILSQGGALAIEDAAVLAQELDRHGLEPAALAAYERRRRPRVAHVIRMSRLHLMLIDSGLAQPSGEGDGWSGRQASAVAWLRNLFEPLRVPA
jgi:2-heptyl-3-hydroxy-4(1H)-quinolone synthase